MKEPVKKDMLALASADKEEQYVHQVYNEIASHFSDTRFKPWPVIARYLNELPAGSYLGVRTGDVFMMGTDRSESLVEICRQRNYECMVSDGLCLPYRTGAFDFAISIAVIHHFSSPDRRLQAVKELLRIVKQGGTVLVTVRRKFDPSTQDVLVPWVVPKSRKPECEGASEPTDDKVYHRYYHLFKEGELDQLFVQAGSCELVESGYDRDNWYVIAKRN
ncbi:S-adenosyl-L-methionine-dependent methyltransferase [Linderina pennispora]|uniref:S-adenosyl-L-methionine-dependent methyltransferase n=1 Tax=Linderina pennispora TaxID=61395 RepID=A0A1Y1W1V0_9FUNG|nr:S-adenosyl-L-methionine-dependent methyltransferase [Linderina pennispora]ORX67523.1 S-adenosyl-L-methionine-dependent methyltransferase [Linderina pennispora]